MKANAKTTHRQVKAFFFILRTYEDLVHSDGYGIAKDTATTTGTKASTSDGNTSATISCGNAIATSTKHAPLPPPRETTSSAVAPRTQPEKRPALGDRKRYRGGAMNNAPCRLKSAPD
jgi:hypothetical protein